MSQQDLDELRRRAQEQLKRMESAKPAPMPTPASQQPVDQPAGRLPILDILLGRRSPATVQPTGASQQLVPTQQPAGAPQQDLSGLTQPSYWDPNEWARRGMQIAEGASALPISPGGIPNPWALWKAFKGAEDAAGQLPPGADPWQ